MMIVFTLYGQFFLNFLPSLLFLIMTNPLISVVVYVLAFTGIIILLTFYLRTRKARKDLELRFTKLVDNAKDFIYTTDVKGNFDFVNEAVFASTGYTKEELLGKNYTFLVNQTHKRNIEVFYKKKITQKFSS